MPGPCPPYEWAGSLSPRHGCAPAGENSGQVQAATKLIAQ